MSKVLTVKVACILMAILCIICTGCTHSSNNLQNETETNGFLTNSDGNIIKTYDKEGRYKHYSLMEFFDAFDDEKPLILYEVDNIAKDEEIGRFYIVANGEATCFSSNLFDKEAYDYDSKYHRFPTLGDVSKMNDSEILNSIYKGYNDSWHSFISSCEKLLGNDVFSERAQVQLATSYPIKAYIETDSSGNNVICEGLFFPEVGVGNKTFVIYYPEYDSNSSFDYYNLYNDNLDKVYFATGYGTKSDINKINNILSFSTNFASNATIYNTNYYALKYNQSEWSKREGYIVFKTENAEFTTLSFDEINSSKIDYIDPNEKDMRNLSNWYFNQYYNSFCHLYH